MKWPNLEVYNHVCNFCEHHHRWMPQGLSDPVNLYSYSWNSSNISTPNSVDCRTNMSKRSIDWSFPCCGHVCFQTHVIVMLFSGLDEDILAVVLQDYPSPQISEPTYRIGEKLRVLERYGRVWQTHPCGENVKQKWRIRDGMKKCLRVNF